MDVHLDSWAVLQRRVVPERQVHTVLDTDPELLFGPALEELVAIGIAEGDADAATSSGLGAEQVDQVEVLLGEERGSVDQDGDLGSGVLQELAPQADRDVRAVWIQRQQLRLGG